MHTDPSNRRRRKDARPQELLDAALALFVEKGFASTRAEEVAQAAGVSKGTLYLYFPSKEDLLKAVIRHHLSSRIAEGLAQLDGHDGPCAPLLRTLLVDWWTQMYDSPSSGVFKLVITEVCTFPEIGDFYHREVVAPAQQTLSTLIERGIAAGEFRRVDTHCAVQSLIFPLVMLCLHRHSLMTCLGEPPLDGPAFIARHIDLVLDGLCSPAAGAAQGPAPGSAAAPAAR